MNTRKKTNWRPRLETLEARRLLSIYADFNGDGRDDLAIGVPGEDNGAGMVQVLYGSATGLTSTGSQSWTQTVLGTDSSEAGDNFGASLASGDYNNDGRADLAVGVPGEDIGSAIDAGSVHFILGSATGLTGAGDYVLHQDTNRVRDIAETGDLFGTSLAAGDWDNDGFIDLGVGVPGQDIPGKVDAGGVHIFYGGGQGIKPPGNQTFNLDTPLMNGTAFAGDQYGSALAAGDFNGDGRDDLAIGIPYAEDGIDLDEGRVGVMYGSSNGLSQTGSEFRADSAAEGTEMGRALAIGDFNGDGRDDLVAGAPGSFQGGYIVIFHGSATTLGFGDWMAQSDFGFSSAAGDEFGAALSASHFNNDGFGDIAIGIPFEETGAPNNAGAVILAMGSATGISTTGSSKLTQGFFSATAGTDDHFGESISAGDFDGNGSADLAIGTPDDDIGTAVDAGTVYVVYGLGALPPQTWNQDITGISDTAETGDGFGGGLDANGGKSAPSGSGRQDLAHLLTADFDSDTPINKLNKRRQSRGRR